MISALPARADVLRDDETHGSKRLYRITFTEEDGTVRTVEDYWSVTTLLRGLPKDVLPRWAARETAEAALRDPDYWKAEIERWGAEETRKRLAASPWTKTEKKMDIGTLVHKQVEALILGSTRPPVPDEVAETVAAYVRQYEIFVERYAPVWEASELVVVHTKHRWAGTLDAIAKIGATPRTFVLDVKTTAPTRNNAPGIYLEAAAQVAMYRHAEIAIGRTGSVYPMPETDAGAILWLAPDRFAFVEVQADGEMYRLARIAAEIFRATDTQRTGWHIVGDVPPVFFRAETETEKGDTTNE